MTNLYLATDHAGFTLKERLKTFLIPNYNVCDFGPYMYDPDDDYPDFITLAARGLQKDVEDGITDSCGIILGGSGQGEAMCANRFPGIRAVVYYGDGMRVVDGKVYDIVALSREHNDANVLSIGARFVDLDKIFLVVNQWLQLSFSNDERHVRRINKLDKLDIMPG